ncbi:hypothetical protein [Rothia mucilaginosa]|uniref:hypothetical protein n=1 Tax=Rothia mucilaginosa TaxID=43675 RepID=UPI0028E745C9|nr:hypothetical protein [Rothia mucilaginosa]
MSQLPQTNEDFDYSPEYAKLNHTNGSWQPYAGVLGNQLLPGKKSFTWLLKTAGWAERGKSFIVFRRPQPTVYPAIELGLGARSHLYLTDTGHLGYLAGASG